VWNPYRRASRVRLPFTVSLFWLVVGVAAVLAALLFWVVKSATSTTENYVVYRERIDLKDDAAQVANQLMSDIRLLQADVLRIASAPAEESASAQRTTAEVAAEVVATNRGEFLLDPERAFYVESGSFQLGAEKPTVETRYFSRATGTVVFDAVPPSEWERLAAVRRNQVVTFTPLTVHLHSARPAAERTRRASPRDAADVDPPLDGPHCLLYAVCPLPGPTSSGDETVGGANFVYVVMSLNPRLDALADDPRHLNFLTHGTVDRADDRWRIRPERWLVHPLRGSVFDHAGPGFEAVREGRQIFGDYSDESLVRTSLEKWQQAYFADPPGVRRAGLLLEGDLKSISLADDVALHYVQSKPLSPNAIERLAGNKAFRTKDLFESRPELANVQTMDIAKDLPQFRLRADSEDKLALAQAAVEDGVRRRVGDDVVEWQTPVAVDDYMLHVNALAYDPGDPDRFLGLIQGVSEVEIKHEVAGAVRDLWFLVICGIGLLAVVALLLGDATRRLNRLSLHALDLSEGDPASAAWTALLPELESKFRTDRGDEVGVLGNTLAGLVGRLRTANADLEQANEALENEKKNLERIVDERTESYEAERDRAEKARRDLNDYVSKVNHEINNPLTILKSWADRLWRAAANGDPGTRQSLGYIRSSAALIEQQVNDLGVATQIGHGDGADFKLDPKAINLAHLIRDTVELMQSRAEKNRNALAAELDPRIERGEIAFESDERRVRQILMNLIGNACKFTEEGRVTVRARVAPKGERDWLRVEVEDTGFGMTQEQRARLFKEYERSTDAEGNDSGTGLGLCVSRHLARRLGGDLDVHRTELGRGTSFLLELPLVEDLPKKPEAAATNGRPAETPAPPRPAAATDLGRGREVLVVDDEAEVRDLIRDHLVARGFVVHTAETAEQALRLARDRRPHAITLDVLLPGSRMNGWDVLAALKADEATADIPVVMITILEDRSHGFALGAADFLSKPIDLDRLADRVQGFCRADTPGRALVVEDDPGQRQAIAERLREDGWEVDQAADGLLGLSAARRRVPDLILLDLAMPQMDGIEFAERLGREPRLAGIPIIVLTGRTLTREERDRLNRRVEAILQKGTSDADAALARVLERVAARHDRPAATTAGGVS